MIIDITGTTLTPGNNGNNCLGNGNHFGNDGNIIECCCDECDYLICCYDEYSIDECNSCTDKNCPHSSIKE